MSSNLLSRPVDVSRFGLIYAGAQKNIGPAGLTIVIIRDDLIGLGQPTPSPMLDYATHAKAGSMYNTPPTYAIYIAGLVFRRLLETGGLAAAEQRNIAKAALLYDYLDSSDFYANPVAMADRSRMNVPFTLADPGLDAEFLAGAAERGLVQLKGHRSVGGMRASLYNAMPIEGVQALVDYLAEFATDEGAEDDHDREVPDPGAQPHLRPRPEAAALGPVRGLGRRRRSARHPGPVGRSAPDGDPGVGAGDRPGRVGHQQHPGRRDVGPRHPGVQRARGQRQRGQGAGAGRHAAGGPQPRRRAEVTSTRSTPATRSWRPRSRPARRRSPATSWPGTPSALSGSARSAAWSPTRRSSSACT